MRTPRELSQMEGGGASAIEDLCDLSAIGVEDRASVWSGIVPALFPGLSVRRVARRAEDGTIRRITLDQGEMWAVRSPSASVSFSPHGLSEDRHLSVMVELAGRTEIAQSHRICTLTAGDLCLLDERSAFSIEGDDAAEMLFVRLPREVVLSRHPHLEHHTAITFAADAPGTMLIAGMLSALLDCGPFLDDPQRRAALAGTIELLGTLACGPDMSGSRGAWWRVQAALSYIELNFARGGLRAEEVARAQHISRRRLDQLLSETTGQSITGHIWKRRLAQASADLRNPQSVGRTASQIAYANGFEDPAHFTRAFKRSYGLSPQQWRMQIDAPSTRDKRFG